MRRGDMALVGLLGVSADCQPAYRYCFAGMEGSPHVRRFPAGIQCLRGEEVTCAYC